MTEQTAKSESTDIAAVEESSTTSSDNSIKSSRLDFSSLLENHAHLLVLLFCILLFFVTYWPLTQTGLLSDDWSLASTKASPEPFAALHGHWFGGTKGAFYRPLPRILLYAQGALFGDSGVGQHLVSMLLHCGVGLFLFFTLRNFSKPIGLAASVLFIFHPASIEAISWVSSQTDLFFLFFFSASVFFFVTFRNLLGIVGGSLMTVLAYMSKEPAIFMGPFFVFASVFSFYLFRESKEFQSLKKYLLFVLGINLLLWIGYMMARKVFLGSFLPDYTREAPFYQMSINSLAMFDGLLRPLVPGWFAERTMFENNESLFIVSIAAVPALFVWSLLKRNKILTLAVLLFGISIGTFIPALPGSANMNGNGRYFYFPLLGFCLITATVLSPLFSGEQYKKYGPLIVTLSILLLVRFVYLSMPTVTDYQNAAEIRQAMERNLDQAHENASEIILVKELLPDHYKSAYIFRNGFPEFFATRYGYGPTILPFNGQIDSSKIDPEKPVYRIQYKGLNNYPIIFEDSEIIELIKKQENRPTAVPVTIDFRERQDLAGRLPMSGDLVPVGIKPEQGYVMKVTGSDPNFAIPFPQNTEPNIYRTITVEMTLVLQEEHTLGENDTCELIFMPAGSDQTPITLSQPLTTQQGWKEYTFDLNGVVPWQKASRLAWIRLDPSTQYRGLIVVRKIELK